MGGAVSLELLPQEIRDAYEVHEWKHAVSILRGDFPNELREILDILGRFQLRKSHVGIPGGNITPISLFFNRAFAGCQWHEKSL